MQLTYFPKLIQNISGFGKVQSWRLWKSSEECSSGVTDDYFLSSSKTQLQWDTVVGSEQACNLLPFHPSPYSPSLVLRQCLRLALYLQGEKAFYNIIRISFMFSIRHAKHWVDMSIHSQQQHSTSSPIGAAGLRQMLKVVVINVGMFGLNARGKTITADMDVMITWWCYQFACESNVVLDDFVSSFLPTWSWSWKSFETAAGSQICTDNTHHLKTERKQNLDRIVVTVGTTQFARDTIFCMFHIQNNLELDMCMIPHAYHPSNKSENSQNQRPFPIMYETPPISYNSCKKHRKFSIFTIQGETGNCNPKKRDCKRDSELMFSKSFT